jgi:hypothetical protein
MQMSNGTKFNIFLALSFIGLWTCNHFKPKAKKEEVVIDNIHIDRQPCVTTINELFGKGVDSVRICNCLIPEFYTLIKSDSSLVERFKQSNEFFKLEGARQDSLIQIFATCVKANIIDSAYKFNLIADNRLAFKNKLKVGFRQRKEFEKIDPERLSNCITDKMSENITLGEYYSNDYFELPKFKKIILDCVRQSASTK